MNKRWLIRRATPEYALSLSRAASISPVLAQVLINRGIKTPGEIKDFLSSGVTNLSDPFELPDMFAAVERIKTSFRRNERVLVHGDYDTDGLTATSLMVHALKAMGVDVHYFIPHRITHGYGFNAPSVDIARKLGARLLITVDCGITAFEAVGAAKEAGVDVIITDHHEPAKKSSKLEVQCSRPNTGDLVIPDAVAVVNPKISDLKSPISDLSGAGVAFKVVQALAMDGAFPFSGDDSLRLLDLAALGTLADVVPLTGENRIILREGMRHIQDARRRGIRSLIEVSGLRNRELRAGLLSFTLVPRINASGRIGDSGDVITLLLSDSDEESLAIAEKLDSTNTERQRIEEETYQEALAQLRGKGYDAAVVLAGEGWHAGVIGIVASRIMEECCRPTFIFTLKDGIAKGSARSVPAFDLHKGLSACSDILLSFGGHRQAAGVKLKESDVLRFEEKMNAVVRDALQPDDFTPTIEIDTEVALYEVNVGLVRELSLLEPVGPGNPEPLLAARRLDVVNPRIVGKNHLKMKLKQKALSLDAIGFDMGNIIKHLSPPSSVDAAFAPAINEWNGNTYVQLTLKACRPSTARDKS